MNTSLKNTIIYSFALVFSTILIFLSYNLIVYFNASVTLPNGAVLKRQFEFPNSERDDMFASDGRTLLARDVEGVCFDDRYVELYSKERGQGGLYDGRAGRWAPRQQTAREIGLSSRNGCNGYFTGMLGPGLLYDAAESPHLPPCSWRNFERPGLADRSWFERPCQNDWPRFSAP